MPEHDLNQNRNKPLILIHQILKAKRVEEVEVMDFLGLVDLRVGSPNKDLYSSYASRTCAFPEEQLAYLVMNGCRSISRMDIRSLASFFIVFKMKSWASSVTST